MAAELTGKPVEEPTKAEQNYAFEVRGNYEGRPLRKCLNCGNGVRVAFLPPRFRRVPPDEWEDLQEQWILFKQQEAERFAALDRERYGHNEEGD